VTTGRSLTSNKVWNRGHSALRPLLFNRQSFNQFEVRRDAENFGDIPTVRPSLWAGLPLQPEIPGGVLAASKNVGKRNMRAGLESRTLLLLALVLFNLLTPGIMLQHATSSNAKSSTPAKPSANLQPSEAYLGGGTVGQARLEATVDVATLPSSRGI